MVLAGGEVVRGRWVFGADGRGSTVARALGLAGARELTGDLAFLFAYWTGLPASEWFRMDVREDLTLVSCPCEDGVHLLVLAGRPPLVRGDRMAAYLSGIRRFPATLNPRLLDRAAMISPVVVAPEPMLRGFFRRACGPGWALVGDAGHFKHPVTAQGISDAVEQAWHVADALGGADPALDGYQAWRDARAAEHYEWSFQSAHLPRPEHAHPVYAGLAADHEAAQQWRDLFTRRRLGELLAGLDEAALAAPVPACPAWAVRDVLAHVTGVAADAAGGTYFADAADAWSDPRWLRSVPVADLAVHLHDVRGALLRPGDRDVPATAIGLRIYARWLGQRLDRAGRPALRLRAGDQEWAEGSGSPAAAVAADPFELFRALSGRRSLDQVRALAWVGDPEPYLDLFAPYPMPASPLIE